MKTLIAIPARYASTRYPGKPLVNLRGPHGATVVATLRAKLTLLGQSRLETGRGASAAYVETAAVLGFYDRKARRDPMLDLWLLALGLTPLSAVADQWRDRPPARLLPLSAGQRLLCDLLHPLGASCDSNYRRKWDEPSGAWIQEGVHIVRLAPGGTAPRRPCAALTNPEQVANMVALDTLTRHRDRYFARGSEMRRNLGNVFLRREPAGRPEQKTLVSLDQSACFRGSASLSPAVLSLADAEDPQLYGLFPELVPFMDPEAVAAVEGTLRTFARQCRRFVQGIPRDWRVSVPTIERMADFLDTRARFLSQRFREMVEDSSSPQRSLRYPGGQA